MNVNFLDEVNIENPSKLFLTIYIGQDKLYISLYNPKKIGSYFFKELTDDDKTDKFSVLKGAFLNSDILSLPFRRVFIMNHTSSFTFVPNSVYKEKNDENFMQFLLSDQQGINMNHTILTAECKVLFKLPEDIYNFALRSFSKPEFIHYSEPLITYFLKNSKNFKNRWMFVNLKETGLDIFCFSRKTFLFGNYFEFNNMQEALYFILFTWKQLQFNQSDDSLYISGETSFSNVLTDNLTLYIQQINRLNFPEANHFEGVETSRIPIELAMLSVCGL